MDGSLSASDSADVAIIGASLAGSAAAATLAREGFRVTVLEKARFPRPRICGEFLSHESFPVLRRLDVLDRVKEAGAEVLDRFSIVRPNGRSTQARLPHPVLSISRDTLDTLVAGAAAASGAGIRFGATVTTIQGDLASGFLVGGPGFEVHARVLVGAWGRYSPLDGRLGRAFFGQPPPLFGFKTHLAAAGLGELGTLTGRAVLHMFEGGYLGLSLVEGGVVNLAALATPGVARDAHHDLGTLLTRLCSESAALARDLRGLSPSKSPVLLSEPVHLGPRPVSAWDVLFVGDAAGVLDPYTGTGMAVALLTGEAAAGPISAFLREELDARELTRRHAERYRSIVGLRFLYSRLFRPFLLGGAASRLVLPAAAPLAALAARLTRDS